MGRFQWLLYGFLLFCAPAAFSSELPVPDGLAVVGLSGGQWKVYIAKEGALKVVDGIEAPRTVAYSHTMNRIAFIGADNILREHDLASGTTLEIPVLDKADRLTQPHYGASGRWLYAVQMPGGKSRRTSIVGFDRETNEQHAFVRKRTAQFEPFMDDGKYLYYSTAICVDDCEGMIWELWRRDMSSGRQVQLTLSNALANQPYVSVDGWLYFSSNADSGRFHIWRMRPTVGAELEQLTRGEVRDSDPITDDHGVLYFLRKFNGVTQLMSWRDGVENVLPVLGLSDLRNLDMGR